MYHEDFIRCEQCGSGDFKKESILTFSKTLRPRMHKDVELEAQEEEILYKCCNCNVELDL